MKFLCPHCERLAALEDFELEGSTLVIRCPACAKPSRVEAAQEASAAVAVQGESGRSALGPAPAALAPAPAAPLSLVRTRVGPELDGVVPPGFCPKCVAPRDPAAVTCRQCGLVYDNFNPAHFELSPELAALWGVARDSGPDDPPLKHLLVTAHQQGELALLGRLYRIRLAHDPHDTVAQRGREEVLRMVSTESVLGAAPGEDAEQNQRRRRWVLACALAVLLFVLFFLTRAVLRMSAR